MIKKITPEVEEALKKMGCSKGVSASHEINKRDRYWFKKR